MNCQEFSVRVLNEAYDKAEVYYKRKFVRARIVIKNTKSKAGHFKPGHKTDSLVAMGYNLTNDLKSSVVSLIAWRKGHIMISDHWYKIRGRKATKKTIYHEVAHALTFELFGNSVKAHGVEWKRIMRVVFGLKPDRCFKPTIEQHLLSEARSTKRRKKATKAKYDIVVDTRTPEQVQADKDRMAKARAARKPKTKTILPALLELINNFKINWFADNPKLK